MYWSSWSYNKGGNAKVAVCNDHDEGITKDEREKVAVCHHHHEVIKKGGSGEVTVYNDQHKLINKEEVKKLRYLMIIMKL